MDSLLSRRGFALLGLLLTACATSSPALSEGGEAPEVVSFSWEEACADVTCVVPLCEEERCAIWRCQDVVEVEDMWRFAGELMIRFGVNGPLVPYDCD